MTAEPQGEEQSMNSLRAFSKSVGTSLTVATGNGVSLINIQAHAASAISQGLVQFQPIHDRYRAGGGPGSSSTPRGLSQ